MLNKRNPEVNSMIFLTLYISLFINFIIPIYVFDIEFIDYNNYKQYAFFVITLLFVFNYNYYERNKYYKKVVLKFKNYGYDYLFNVIGVFFPFFTFLIILILFDFTWTFICVFLGILILIEIFTSLFGNKW